MKRTLFLFIMTLLPLVTATTFTSCGDDDEIVNPNGGNNGQQNQAIVVTVDSNGNAKGGHRFEKIDDANFYIDDIKYTAQSGDLVVTGYNQAFFKGIANIISQLKYQGRTMNVVSIGNTAFYKCSNLTSVTVPNSVTSISASAFQNCTSLTSIKVETGNTTYDSRANCNAIIETATNTLIAGCKNTVIPSSVTSIGSSAFYECISLTSITIPHSVTSIGNGAFQNCYYLTSITIPYGVTSIGFDAFQNCVRLASITIGSRVASIGWYAFYNCPSLTNVYCYAVNVPYAGHDEFNSSISSATLHVPAGSISAYKARYPWCRFGSIVAIE